MTSDNKAATHCGAMECEVQTKTDAGDARPTCLCCGRHVDLFARTMTSAVRPGTLIAAGVCPSCVNLAAQANDQAVTEMAMAASRLADYLALIRRGAARELAGWWGGIGACTQDELDGATVALRRALERNGWRR